MNDLKTDPALLAAIRRAADHVMTPEERYAQRRSFVIGQIWGSHPEKSREEVAALVDQVLGAPVQAKAPEPTAPIRATVLAPKDAGIVAGEAYQVIAALADAGGLWDRPEVREAFAYFSREGWAKGREILPFVICEPAAAPNTPAVEAVAPPPQLDDLGKLSDAATPGVLRGGHRCDGAIRVTVDGERVSIGTDIPSADAAYWAALANAHRTGRLVSPTGGGQKLAAWLGERIESARKDAAAHPPSHGNRAFYNGQAAAYENALGALTRVDTPLGMGGDR